VLRFSPFGINPQMLGTYSLIYYRHYIIVTPDSVIKYHTWKRKMIIHMLKIPVWFILIKFFVWRHWTCRTAYWLLFIEFLKTGILTNYVEDTLGIVTF
jgi:hypothetical protein